MYEYTYIMNRKETEEKIRIAVVDADKCKPKKCNLECKKKCPVVRIGQKCIDVNANSSVAFISESMCTGCGGCIKACPYKAIKIINLPKNLSTQTTHRYGPNSFKLHGLPIPKKGQVLGLVGTNGIGKSTVLKILSGKLQPNLGKFDEQQTWENVLDYFKGSELQNHFLKISENKLTTFIKPQYVETIISIKGTVGELIDKFDTRNVKDQVCEDLDLTKLRNRQLTELSGGELQLFAIAMTVIQKADCYMFDEPSSYLDIKQRLAASKLIRSLADENTYVIVVEHDLSILDYLSDFICVLYGVPGVYGVATLPFSVREGINVFLAGFIPTENLRFRECELSFKYFSNLEEDSKNKKIYSYPDMVFTHAKSNFKLNVKSGTFNSSEIIVLLGQNGTGKTTLIELLAGKKKQIIIPII